LLEKVHKPQVPPVFRDQWTAWHREEAGDSVDGTYMELARLLEVNMTQKIYEDRYFVLMAHVVSD
jgi:hypothetical protein